MSKRSIRSCSWILPLSLMALGIGGCDSTGPEGPRGPGFLLVTLLSPSGQDGSAVFELTGGEDLGDVFPVEGEVFYRPIADVTRVVAVMDDPGAVQFRIRTGNVGTLPQVAVLQVADGNNDLRDSLAGYSVSIVQEKDSSGKKGGT